MDRAMKAEGVKFLTSLGENNNKFVRGKKRSREDIELVFDRKRLSDALRGNLVDREVIVGS